MDAKNRRNFLKGGMVAAGAGAAAVGAKAQTGAMKKVHYANGQKPKSPGLFNRAVSYGNLLYIAGIGYHKEGDIKVHTKGVLDELEASLKMAGSSMEKVLKCNVYLADLNDYAGMNEVFKGRFGEEPPVRTTIAAAGLPGNSKVEIDVIAYI